MREQFDDYEKRIMEKIDREAEEIQHAVENCSEAAEARASETLDQKVYAGIEAYEKAVATRKASEKHMEEADGELADNAETDGIEDTAIAALSEKDREALRLGRELQARLKEEDSKKTSRKKTGIQKYIRRIAAAVVVLIITASVGVQSIGGPERIVEIVQTTLAGRDSSRVNSGKKEAKIVEDVEESKAYQEIKDELGIDPVKVLVVPGKMKYKYCEVDSDIRMAQFLYEYDDRNLSYLIDASYTEETWGTDIEDKKIDEYIYTNGELEAKVTEYKVEESDEKRYSAEFEYDGVYYQLIGTINKEEFEEILKNLYFPS